LAGARLYTPRAGLYNLKIMRGEFWLFLIFGIIILGIILAIEFAFRVVFDSIISSFKRERLHIFQPNDFEETMIRRIKRYVSRLKRG